MVGSSDLLGVVADRPCPRRVFVRACSRLRLILLVGTVALSSVALAAIPHEAFGPNYIGYGDVIRVDLDTACNVFAVSTWDYQQYRRGRNFNYYGGHATQSPFYIKPPPGTYYVVIDNGGDGYSLRAAVHVIHTQ
jgi:hypothetical protein